MWKQPYLVVVTVLLVVAVAGMIVLQDTDSGHAQQGEDTIARSELDGLPENILLTVSYSQGDGLVLYNWRQATFTPVTYVPGHDSNHGTWSPDGEQIAFQTNRDGDWEIYLHTIAEGEDFNLTQRPASSDMYPNWSPAGEVVHFSNRSGEEAIWLTDPADASAAPLTTQDGCVPDYHPNFAQDGTAMAYRADCAGSGDIWHLDLERNERTNLTADSPATDRYPAWSPDGTQILFVSNRDGNEEIYLMDADGSNSRNLSNHPAEDNQGSWSPDGRFIVFTSDRDGQTDLWIMEANGDRPTRLATTTDEITAFNWPWWEPMPEEEPTMSGQGNADVEYVSARLQSDGTWTFSVTVRHPDTGWEDYADGWDVVLPDGTVLKPDPDSPFTRLLLHPHENEQPFTRSQGGIEIPDGVSQVTVRAHDLVDGWGGQTVTVDLTQSAGEHFEVVR
ncbi:MAG: hypothetical protein GYB66_12905 [Chloroflexi bacterium]|nr:hypothetical protein [Chloroflexota bacterium]